MPRRSVLLKVSLVALTAALVACSAVAAFLSVRQVPPALEAVPGTSIDLGTVLQGSVAKTQITLRNRSGWPLDITRIVNSCGCSTAVPEKNQLAPGESTSLEASFEAGASRGDVLVGVIVVYRMRQPSESKVGRLDLTLRASVDPDFLLTPEALTFHEGLGETQSVLVTANRLERLEVIDAYCTHKAFRAELKSAGAAVPAQYRVDVSFTAENWTPGSRSAELTIQTNSQSARLARITLDVKGTAVGESKGLRD